MPLPLLLFALFVLGAVLASFTGVVVERAFTGQSILTGRSRCNSCARTLSPADLFPVFSWLLRRGRCPSCKARIPGRYALTEAILGVLFVLSYLHYGVTPAGIVLLITLPILLGVVLYDLMHTVVPWQGSVLLFLSTLAFAIAREGITPALGYTLLCASGIALAFLLLHVCSGGRAMGLGDTPIALSLSLLAGFPLALSGLAFSFWIGAVAGIAVLSLRRGGPRMGIEVPFVPFLALGFLLALFTQWNVFPFF